MANIVTNNQVDQDKFSILFCGTGSPNRSTDRGQPCTALIADGKLFLFDAGEGAIGKLIEYNAPIGKLQSIFLTHLHSDHISGVAEVLHNTWLYGRRSSVDILGPPGTEHMINNFKAAYTEDLTERQRVLRAEKINAEVAFSTPSDISPTGDLALTVYDNNGLIIKAFLVDHPDWSHAYGYRIEYKDKIIVISGDTKASDGIRRHAENADLLIHEALNSEIFNYVGKQFDVQGGPMPKSRIQLITDVHTPTLELAALAQEANVKFLAITHLIPAIPAIWFAEQFFISNMDDIYKGKIAVARDGQEINLNQL